MQKIEVQEYGLFQFMVRIQELFEEGYRFDFTKNENVPMSYGTLYVGVMIKPEVKPAVEPVKETVEPTVVSDEAPAVEPSVESVVARKTAKAGKA